MVEAAGATTAQFYRNEQNPPTVAEALRDLSSTCDVVVLAQASMARVADAQPPAEKPAPVLSSPALAINYLASMLLHS